MDGIIIVNKDTGMTSRDVINHLNRFFETQKIGHAGTLDPLATGVLVVAIGKCTKFISMFTNDEKEYIATMKLGLITDTYDIEGKVINTSNVVNTKDEIINTINSFKGKYLQEVPIYSAVKINGKKLYEYARNNEVVDLPKREVNIKNIEVLSINENIVIFKTLVSKGTYIRSLINDIGNKLSCGAIMTDLQRTKQGDYLLKDSFTLDEITNNNYKLISINDILASFPSLNITDENKLKLIKNGAIINKEFTSDYFVYYDNNIPIAIYQEYLKDNTKVKPFIML